MNPSKGDRRLSPLMLAKRTTMIKFLKSRFVLWCLLASGLLSVTMLVLSMHQVRLMRVTKHPFDDLPPVSTRKQWTVPGNQHGKEGHDHSHTTARGQKKVASPISVVMRRADENTETRDSSVDKVVDRAPAPKASGDHHDSNPHSRSLTNGTTIVSRAPLETLISDTDRGIKTHVSHLLDWAVIGHAKCATSFIMKWLDRHPEVATWDEEVCDLFDNRPAGLVSRLYQELPAGNYKRGFKCPAHFSRRAIRFFKRYFGQTRIVVGVRHPVRWFESFYNFRMRHAAANYTLPPPNQLIGECTIEADGVCTDRANFHTNLAVFGKTPMEDAAERNLIRFRKYSYETTYEIDNPIFLYDVAQFYDNSTERMETFKTDLQHFLGLKAPMPEPSDKDAGKSSRVKTKAIDICSPEFEEVRKELVQVGIRASMWIRKYFMKSEQVFVSSPEHFEEILKDWKVDPCTIQTAKSR